MPNTNEDFDVTTISNNTADNWLLEELDVLTGTVLDTLATQTGNDTFDLSLNLSNTSLHRYKVKAFLVQN